MTLNDVAKEIVVRNLRRREDRLFDIAQELSRVGVKYWVFDCADDKATLLSATWWNAQNALQCIRYAKKAELENILLLDDDCVFAPDFNKRFDALWPHVPENWDIVSFGEIYGSRQQVYPGIVRATHSWGGHASLIRNTMYDKLLNTLTGDTWADEEVNIKLKGSINFYAFSPYLITQKAGHSDLKHRFVDNREFV